MARPGPAPLPQEIREARGTNQPCRSNPDRPVLPYEVPPPPAWLTAVQSDDYADLAELIGPMNITTAADAEALATLALARRRLIDANDALQESTVIDEDGRRTGHAVEREKALTDYTRLLREFGMSPSSRNGVAVVKPAEKVKPKDPKAAARRAQFKRVS